MSDPRRSGSVLGSGDAVMIGGQDRIGVLTRHNEPASMLI